MTETQLKTHFRHYSRRERFPNIQKPQIIEGFCLEQDRSFCDSRKYLKYFCFPEGNFDYDLNTGYESYVPGPKGVHITSLLQFIGRHWKRLLHPSENRLAADFVCYRRLLTQICITPYFTRDSWSVLAIKYRGTVYLCNYVSPEKMKEYEARDTEYANKCRYYGKNFERFVLTEDPAIKNIPPPTLPLQDIEEFDIALTTKLDGFQLLYAAEMDGVVATEDVSTKDLNELEFVEVKTRLQDTTEQQYRNYVKWKLPKWWMQSFLVGIETIYEGFRTREGHVQQMKMLPVRQIPKMAEGVWSPAVMMRFGADFLATVNAVMGQVDCPWTVYKFGYDSNRSWNVTFDVFEGKNEYSFLPQSHIDLMEQLKGKSSRS